MAPGWNAWFDDLVDVVASAREEGYDDLKLVFVA
jgi:hypothetical protein